MDAEDWDDAIQFLTAWSPCDPVIGLPTSVGYGVGEGGKVALDALLQSCAPGIAVVNIDNGFGAGVFALTIVNGD